MNRYKAHQELIAETEKLCAKEFPGELRLFSRPVGTFYVKRIANGIIDYLPYKIGKIGQADSYGYYRLHVKDGFFITLSIELEYKTGKASLNKDQIRWRDFCQAFDILWFEVRNPEQFVFELKNRIELIKTNLQKYQGHK